jgi:hypothetical protein
MIRETLNYYYLNRKNVFQRYAKEISIIISFTYIEISKTSFVKL